MPTFAPHLSLAGPSAHMPSPGGHAPGSRVFAAQRALDVLAGSVLLILSLPVLGLAVLAVKLTSRGPAIYTQTRLGRFGRPFLIYKIRSMTHDCEKRSGVRWSARGDARVTPVGRILRKTHVDELPQLVNILRGQMSLVGPRPERPEFVGALEAALPRYRDRLAVRPGLTGLAQVQLPPDTDIESVRRKLRYDLHYVATGGVFTDVRLLAATAFHVAGLPFAVSRVLLGLPGGPEVEPERVSRPRSPICPAEASTVQSHEPNQPEVTVDVARA